MKNVPFWIDSVPIKRFPRLQRNINVEVLVVGAGVTGITTAYLLKRAGLTVALTERERVALIDTGHTTAHLAYVTDVELKELRRNFGEDHAQAAWDAGAAAIDEIEAIVEEEEIDCEFTRVPAYVHVRVGGSPKKEASQLMAEFDAKTRRARINRNWISFDRVMMATNNPLVGLASMTGATLLQTKLFLYTSYALGARVPSGTVPEALFWDTRDPYDYLRVDCHSRLDYIVYGGEEHKTGQKNRTEKAFVRLWQRLKKIIPEARVDHRWSGQVISTPDGLPYIGENAERQFIATGYCGNGITFGTVSAMMARDWATKRKNPWTDLFAVDRKKIKGAAWNYIRENKDYPYYLIKDRIARPEAESVRELKPGNGMIIGSRGKKRAVFRDRDGQVHELSPVCTHMGCLVRWNPAESTWDCPCHGSRFKPTGEVIAGPAEEPLTPI
jgi:glycine/D-amino acid oxidase-like deaminating enzyme/nitrite reductase/ring-hydroxylating ferredoxin subunit